MDYVIEGYQPEKLFHFFEEISSIPRGSGNEKGISDYLMNFARERGLEAVQDEHFNVIIRKEGNHAPGGISPVMLQGHMDMVCEKRSGSSHDFEKEGLELFVEDGELRARDTTLGADNGVAVALMMTVLDDESLVHPPLECVFTVEEEVGLNGAKLLDKSQLRSKIMINLDSEEEGVATVSCAGGMRLALTRKICRRMAEGALLHIVIDGLKGGHSGTDIHKERANANLLMARMASFLQGHAGGFLVDMRGGSKDNAIPRECSASILYEDGAEAGKAAEMAERFASRLAGELREEEPDFSCDISLEQETAAKVMEREDAKALIGAMRLAPNGVLKRNPGKEGFIVVSSNLGVVKTSEEEMAFVCAPRSSSASLQKEIKGRIRLLAESFGFSVEAGGEYPGWEYREDSRIREVFQECYRELFRQELKIEAIHAGLECGLFSDGMEGLDAIAVGPSIYGCHTPDEVLPLESLERFYALLCCVLERLAQ